MQHWCLNVIRRDFDKRFAQDKRYAGDKLCAVGRRCAALLLACLLIPAALAQGSPFGSSAPRFLDVDEAFSFYVALDSRSQISVHWTIASGYYLYQDKFQFRIIAPEGLVTAIKPQLPAGVNHNDEFFGDVVVYYGQMQTILNLPEAISEPFMLEVEFQGCAEAGLCYPPQRKPVEIFP
jgi:thioredoxin:protein disulfide reductase